MKWNWKMVSSSISFLWVGTHFGPVLVPGKAGTKVQSYTEYLDQALSSHSDGNGSRNVEVVHLTDRQTKCSPRIMDFQFS